jgi:hypothetical protein
LGYSTGYNGYNEIQDLLRTSTGYIGIQYRIEWEQYRIYRETLQYRIYWDTVKDIMGYTTEYIGILYRIYWDTV